MNRLVLGCQRTLQNEGWHAYSQCCPRKPACIARPRRYRIISQRNDYPILKVHLWEHFDNIPTDQQRDIAPHPIQKSVREDAVLVNLVV